MPRIPFDELEANVNRLLAHPVDYEYITEGEARKRWASFRAAQAKQAQAAKKPGATPART
jgi:hypothetical protein